MEKPVLPPLTKICSICGQQKPYSAFLQLAGPQGATYGNVCASCRRADTEKAAKKKEPEEETKSSTGFKIDAKAKVHDAVETREQIQKTKELHEEDRKKKEEIKLEKTERMDVIFKTERKHRESFLGGKGSFLTTGKKSEGVRVTGEAKQRADQTAREQAIGTQAEKAAQNLIEAAKEEQKLTAVDFAAGPHLDTYFAGKIKYDSETFRRFKDLIGGAAPIAGTLNQVFKKAQPTQKSEEARGPEKAAETIKKNWGPSSRG